VKIQAVKLVSGGFLLEDPSSQRKIVDLTNLIWTGNRSTWMRSRNGRGTASTKLL